MYIVLYCDMEEADADQAVIDVFGPFDSSEAAEKWAGEQWDELDEETQESFAFVAELVKPIEKYEKPS